MSNKEWDKFVGTRDEDKLTKKLKKENYRRTRKLNSKKNVKNWWCK